MTYSMAKARFIHTLRFIISCILAGLALGALSSVKAAGFEELHHFPRFGWDLRGLVRAPDGDFYGVTVFGGLGRSGTLYRLSAANGTTETLTNFGAGFG